MKNLPGIVFVCLIALSLILTHQMARQSRLDQPVQPADREEVVFWHFWGGKDRAIVEQIADDFNQSQEDYWVRAIAMPGNNLDTKIFLSVTGGDPPDLVNQDDPIVADWAQRGLIECLEDVATPDEIQMLGEDLLPAAKSLGTYQDQLYALCNGLDIRALYYNKTVLDQYQLDPPTTIKDLDRIAQTIAPIGKSSERKSFGYLPDSRRLWAWGYVFGGEFIQGESQVSCDSPPIVAAANWMSQYSDWYGADNIAAFRQGDQSLPNKSFPLLPLTSEEQVGRYVLLMDGQWRTRDIKEFTERHRDSASLPEFGVCGLPQPPGGRANAGWVNGNFFVIPKTARNKPGAWEFAKFWVGVNNRVRAAQYCQDGGWIPTTNSVSESPEFQAYLKDNLLFAEFVKLSRSKNQFPVPVVPGAPLFKRKVEQTASRLMTDSDLSAAEELGRAKKEIQTHLNRSRNAGGGDE